MIRLGDKVKDTVTGYTGIVVARTEWLHGCVRVMVQSDKLGDDGKPHEGCQFDEPQVVLVKPRKVLEGSHVNGGPAAIPTRRSVAR